MTTDQKLIEQRLTSEQNGLLEELRKIERETSRNRLDQPRFQQQLQTLISDLETLDRSVFPSLNQFLVRIDPRLLGIKSSEAEIPKLTDPVDPLELNRLLEQSHESIRGSQLHQLIESRQKRIEEVLGDLTGAIDEWQEGQTLKNSLSQMLETQEQIDRDAKQLHTRTLGKNISELSPAEREQLRQLSAGQQDNQQSLNRFRQQLERETPEADSPEHLNDLAEAISQSNATARMGELEREFRENHLGQALDRNQKLLSEMKSWDDLLHNRPVTGAEMKMQLLEKQLSSLNELQMSQKQLERDAEAAVFRNEIPDERRAELTEAQRKLERNAGRIERNFHRLQLDDPEHRMSDARREMQQSNSELSRGHVPEESFQETENLLEQAVESVLQARKQLQREHERELAADLLPRLRELHREEGNLLAESTKLHVRQLQAERWNRQLLRELKLVQKTQEALRQRLTDLAKPLASVEAIELALNHVGTLMTRTVSALEERDVQAASERHIPAALGHLEIILSVLEQAAARQMSAGSANQ
ncbi:MAG TPA: hypothetical protein VLA12_23990, partial [Planctomycetaceae bacterium]|nr:hypothetical protein [Planctomycetaceae bacterium]